MKWVICDSNGTLERILPLARGDYQRRFLLGEYRPSGADLRGTAKRFGASYRRSRAAVLARVVAAGYVVSDAIEHRRRIVRISARQ